jgi:hypothetical protein
MNGQHHANNYFISFFFWKKKKKKKKGLEMVFVEWSNKPKSGSATLKI